jgi:periplasmic protein CpxP/Spy
MKSEGYLKYIVIGLLLSNLMLIVMMMKKDERPPHRGRITPREHVINALHFDKKQVEAYDELIVKHRSSIREQEHKIRGLKNEIYKQLTSPQPEFDPSLRDSLAASQAKIEQIHFEHFLEIKSLCKQEQLPLFDELSRSFSDLFSPPEGPPPHRPAH